MLFLAVLALSMSTVRPAGGRYTVLAEITLRRWGFVVAALAGQILLISVIDRPSATVAGVLHLATYAIAAGFLIANRQIRGVALIAAGAALNVAAIAVNGGTMPAASAALRSAGIAPDADHFNNSATVVGARLPWLGDVFAVPARFGALANVFSIGDAVLCVGVVLLIHHAAGCPWTGRVRDLPPSVTAEPARAVGGAELPGSLAR